MTAAKHLQEKVADAIRNTTKVLQEYKKEGILKLVMSNGLSCLYLTASNTCVAVYFRSPRSGTVLYS